MRITDRSEITEDTPHRLTDAAALAFPDGCVTTSSLRRERDAGRLVIEFVAAKDYTTFRYITQMRKACQGLRRASVIGRKPMDAAARKAQLEAAQASAYRTIDRLRQELSKPPPRRPQVPVKR